jgi:hypothetical protein
MQVCIKENLHRSDYAFSMFSLCEHVYALTHTGRSQEMLPLVAEGRGKEVAEVVSVTKRVYASPSYTSGVPLLHWVSQC